MELSFTKMHGLGNDFVLLDGLSTPIDLTPAQVRKIADRRLGVGCDQILLIEPPAAFGADVRYRIFNADGGEVGQCGNGSRCVARYLREAGLMDHNEIALESTSRIIRTFCRDDGLVEVDMGVPSFAPRDIPMRAEARAKGYPLAVADAQVLVYALSIGNPHAVMRVDDVATVAVATLGPLIAKHRLFPEGANAGFMQIVDSTHIRLRVYERGVGETPACGTGACAAVAAGRMQNLLENEVDVELPGGHLSIRWEGEGQSLWMSGPASRVFEGRMRL